MYLQTGQRLCYDAEGREIPCQGTGQDGELARGLPWPDPRFRADGEVVTDRLTGLVWTRSANAAELPLAWAEAFGFVSGMNRAGTFGFNDWRLPNRRELRSLVSHQTRRPALPGGHPFRDVFQSWYWSSTTAVFSPAHAWYLHLEGARMFYGHKEQAYLVWPVRGPGNGLVPETGQRWCYGGRGTPIPCSGTGQDGDLRCGKRWPESRYLPVADEVRDALTGLSWLRQADWTRGPVTWEDALASVAELNARGKSGGWRLPNINELESLVDCGSHSPALPGGGGFEEVRSDYWSATTSAFEPDWAWALYLDKGAVGVGQKGGRYFHVWPVRDGS